MDPTVSPAGPFDGVLCFSQGCAVSAGLLFDHYLSNYNSNYSPLNGSSAPPPPFKFAIFICGGRPFSPRTSQRFTSSDLIVPVRSSASHTRANTTITIPIPTCHVLGKHDPGLPEGQALVSLCDARTRETVEFEGGHAPPRKSVEVERVVDAIRRTIGRALGGTQGLGMGV